MKNLLYGIIAFFVLVGCSKNDDSVDAITNNGALVLKIEQKDLTVGEEVKFIVTNAEGGGIKSNIFIDGAPALTKHIFRSEGTFNIIAKRTGYTDSNTLKVTVGAKRLLLKADKTKVNVNEYVTFSVLYNNKEVNEEVFIYNNKTNEVLDSPYFKPTEAGTYSFIAKSTGYSDSYEVTIEVNAPVDRFVLQGQTFAIDDYILVLSRELHIDKLGNEKVVDEVRELPDGRLANVYYYLLGRKIGEDWDVVFVDFLVANPSIIKKNGKIVDYGVRALPKKGEDIMIESIYANVEGDIYDVYFDEILDSKVVLQNLEVAKNGLFDDDYDYKEHDDDRYLNGTINTEMSIKSPIGNLEVFYNSSIRFYDKVSYIEEVEEFRRTNKSTKAKSSQRSSLVKELQLK